MKADPKATPEAAPAKSKKMLIIILAVVMLAVGGGAAWFFTKGSGDKKEHKAEVKPAAKPEFVVIEPFTVNLAPEEGLQDQYLQIQFTLQVAGPEQAELVKTNMARVRSRVLLLLSAKKSSELNTTEGKGALSKEIITAINQPFAEKGQPQEVTDVLFTNFIIQ
ncbi:flagellar basal body-associated protein FliL [Massilia sp. CF038]|uniref:flagellar basal body-associated protein FliL n=1 Tax=Massilia sp. CF038 TaxID=1881045 RepID=UPI000914D7FB|nr:flagellar basal body-associated protein FliL [Massilia sp. CF038]SHG44636.1 flagellar FliL protein [Massilia sp. CF038]